MPRSNPSRLEPLLAPLALAAATILLAELGGAQDLPYLVRDIDAGADSAPSLGSTTSALTVGSISFAAFSQPELGRELWRTDGTPGGTVLLRDLEPGPSSSELRDFTSLGGVLYFTAMTRDFGRELWRSDGTTAGTYLVRDIYPGAESSTPIDLTVSGGMLFFSAVHPTSGRELWRSDGTSAGTVIVTDLRPGVSSSMSTSSEIAAGTRVAGGISFSAVLFTANDGISGEELWETTALGVQLRADIRPGAGSSTPRGLHERSGHVMFAANDGSTGVEPYYTRTSGATRIADIQRGSNSSNPDGFAAGTVGGSLKFFYAANTPLIGVELWCYDTANSTNTLLRDINPGNVSSQPVTFIAGSLALVAATTAAEGRELWRSDGTPAGTVLVKNIATTGGSSPEGFVTLSTAPLRVVFEAQNSAGTNQLWVTDGTNAGTSFVTQFTNGSLARPVAALPGARALGAGIMAPLFPITFVTDGTAAGTTVLETTLPLPRSSHPRDLLGSAPGAAAWLVATTSATGEEPFRSDGSAAGTQLVTELRAGTAAGVAPRSPGVDAIEVAGLVYFAGTTTTEGTELWVSDRTAAGTRLVLDIAPGSASSTPREFAELGGIVYFTAEDPTHGRELWRSDGTATGTTLVRDVRVGTGWGVGGTSLWRVGSHLFFAGTTDGEGTEPWISDGTPTGTRLLLDIYAGTTSSMDLLQLHVAEGTDELYFVANQLATGTELWRTAGTPSSTQRAVDLTPGQVGTRFGELFFHERLYFTADNGVIPGVFVLDPPGTSASYLALHEPPADTEFVVGACALTAFGNGLLYAGYDPATGWEPWVSRGSFNSTNLLRDVAPGATSSIPHAGVLSSSEPAAWFFVAPGAERAYFNAADLTRGVELWRTDGTTAGTVLHAELRPGPGSSSPTLPRFAGDLLYFSAYEPVAGRELYAMAPPASFTLYGGGCPGQGGAVPTLEAANAPTLGNTGFALRLERGLPASLATLHLGFAPWAIPLGGGCELHVNLLLPFASLSQPIVLGGRASFALPLPSDPLLDGAQIFAQGYVLDPSGAFANALSFSGGLRALLRID